MQEGGGPPRGPLPQPPVPAVGDSAHERNDWTLGREADERFTSRRGEWWEPAAVQVALDSPSWNRSFHAFEQLRGGRGPADRRDQRRTEHGRTWRMVGSCEGMTGKGRRMPLPQEEVRPTRARVEFPKVSSFCSAHGHETLTVLVPRTLSLPECLGIQGEAMSVLPGVQEQVGPKP